MERHRRRAIAGGRAGRNGATQFLAEFLFYFTSPVRETLGPTGWATGRDSLVCLFDWKCAVSRGLMEWRDQFRRRDRLYLC